MSWPSPRNSFRLPKQEPARAWGYNPLSKASSAQGVRRHPMTGGIMNSSRRDLLTAAGAALTTSLFTGSVKGANDRVAVGFIGLGAMGSGNLEYSMKVSGFVPTAICDVYQPHLERAEASARRGGFQPKSVKDFRDILADKSIDAVCISTP